MVANFERWRVLRRVLADGSPFPIFFYFFRFFLFLSLPSVGTR